MDCELNGFAVCMLLDLGAEEALPTIARAFVAGRVPSDAAGDWPTVERDLRAAASANGT